MAAGITCPFCQSPKYQRLRCNECPQIQLENALSGSEAGQLLGRATALRRATQLGLSVTLDDISCEVYHVLDLMDAEERKYETERNEEREREWRAKSR